MAKRRLRRVLWLADGLDFFAFFLDVTLLICMASPLSAAAAASDRRRPCSRDIAENLSIHGYVLNFT